MSQPFASNFTANKLTALRAAMAGRRPTLDAWLTPSSDEHLNEYLPEGAKRREWLTGFDGSAGDALVTVDEAWLFVDGRYHQQAGEQVDPACFRVSRLGIDGQPTLSETLQRLARQHPGFRIGFDPWTLSLTGLQTLESVLRPLGARLTPAHRSLTDRIWGRARPPRPAEQIYALPPTVSGETAQERIKRLRQKVSETLRSDDWLLPLARLDHIAWLFNLRGRDIPYNPVFMSYALITPQEIHLFAADRALSPEANDALRTCGVTVSDYQRFAAALRAMAADRKTLLDPEHVTVGIARALKSGASGIAHGVNPIPAMKTIKTPDELRGMRQAHLRASLALVRFWRQLEQAAHQGISEAHAARMADDAYAADPTFAGLSFNTIAAYGANGALIHYGEPSAETRLQPGGLFLLDSGAHYLDLSDERPWAGTTDTTRVFAIGKPDETARARFTAVLGAHADCLSQRFPQGTTGIQLDAITRASLWNAGLDFRHGTGHGVGAFLNVHEGPAGIHARARTALAPGMVVSVEPGYYQPGWGGVRIENLAEVVALKTPDGQVERIADDAPAYGFESLIYVPYDRRLIDPQALSLPRRAWIDAYHRQTLARLEPYLTPEEYDWLKPWTQPL
ncbi:MAG: M24 family metallopeptidase [Vampirovibrionales bacterium]|nr:M24 family metallopeptidase [Vampirovibrionales bacterium]